MERLPIRYGTKLQSLRPVLQSMALPALLRTMRLAQVLVRPIRYGTQLMALVPVLQSMALQSIQLSGVSA